MFGWLRKLFGHPKKKIPKESGPLPIKRSSRSAISPSHGQKYKKIVTVGVDFGTSGTKVILGDVNTGKHYLVDPPATAAGYPPFVFPSTIRISDGHVFFCPVSVQDEGRDSAFRSFKICLACEIGIARCRECDHRLQNKKNGRFEVASEGHDFVISAHELCTWYLAYVFNVARHESEERWEDSFELDYVFNVGAPIDQHNLEKGEDAFNKAAFWAEKMSSLVEDGKSIDTLIAAYKDVSSSCPIVPAPENRKTFVQPETAAGLMSFVMSPSSPPGLYGIVDVGAGTTDVSFFRLSDIATEAQRVMAFYDAGTAVVGSGDIDSSLARHVLHRLSHHPEKKESSAGDLINACRLAKENTDGQQSVKISWAENEISLSGKDVEKVCSPVINAMVSHYIETNHSAYEKEKKVARWKTYTLFFLGGGTRLSAVANALTHTRPSEYNLRIQCKRMEAPKDFEAPNIAKKNFDLLAVAYGLSYHPIDFPHIFDPNDVGPLEIKFPPSKNRDIDDLYYDP